MIEFHLTGNFWIKPIPQTALIPLQTKRVRSRLTARKAGNARW